jgi:tetratricopeptide (TPR) repeat protein
VSPPAAAAAASASVGVGASGFSGSAQIEHLLLEAEARMIVSDYANASTVYARLVELAPRITEYRVRLAVAMAQYPRTAKQAEREFLEAVRLDPDNADLHYKFAMYYKAMKQRARAQAELQTALRINRRHADAKRELEALSPDAFAAVMNLKKLFR